MKKMEQKKRLKIAQLSSQDLNLYLFSSNLINLLKVEGHDLYAIAPGGEYLRKLAANKIQTLEYPLDRKSINPLKELSTIISLYRLFRSNRFDLLHIHTLKPNLYGTITAKLAGIPIVINSISGLGHIYTIKGFRAGIMRFFVSLFYFITFKLSDNIFFQNRDDYILLSKFFNKRKARIIPGYGLNTNRFSLDNIDPAKISALRKELPIDKDAIVITVVSRLLKHKGIMEYVAAANELTGKYENLLFLVVGCADKGNPAALSEDYVRKAQENTRIKFLGFRDDIPDILAITDIFTLPSYYREGIPSSILEAMAMEKPIVTTDMPGCKDTVEEGKNGFLVPPGDPYSLSLALEKLVINAGLRKKMGKFSREKVVREFSFDILSKKILEAYNEAFKKESLI